MFENGLEAEVRGILALGFSPACKPFESHGYKQAMQLIQGELNPRDALFYAQRNTRHYAKRQITWFRRERDLQWLKGFGDAPHIRQIALASVASFLSASA
jgi:tRNA dimethylallyltransferase